MECFICGKKIQQGYFCDEHLKELKEMLYLEKNIIKNPNERHHCMICGEYQDRVIIEYPNVGYICDKDIENL